MMMGAVWPGADGHLSFRTDRSGGQLHACGPKKIHDGLNGHYYVHLTLLNGLGYLHLTRSLTCPGGFLFAFFLSSRQFFRDDLVTEVDAFVADIHAWTRDQLLHLLLALAAEGALEKFPFVNAHGRPPDRITVGGEYAYGVPVD
jgi:hypothetical protein